MKLHKPTAAQLQICAGALVIAMGTNLVVLKSGGSWLSTNGLVAGALGFALIVAAIYAGRAWAAARTPAIFVVMGMICTEGYNLFVTLEASMIARAQTVAPVVKLLQKRDELRQQHATLEAKEPTSPRLNMAKEALELAQTGADTPAVRSARAALEAVQNASVGPAVLAAEKAAKDARDTAVAEGKDGGCKSACKRREADAERLEAAYTAAMQRDAQARDAAIARAQTALQDAIKASTAEQGARIVAAEAEVRAALDDATASHAKQLSDLKAAIDAIKEPDVSPTHFADKTGVPDWLVDVLAALARSLAINLTGVGLLSVGAHMTRSSDNPKPVITGSDNPPSDPVNTQADPVNEKPQADKPSGGSDNGPGQSRNRPRGGTGMVKLLALEEVTGRLAAGRDIDCQQELADTWGIPKTTVSGWMLEWEREGLIPKAERVGRRKVIRAVVSA